jgi:hypothetical protein
MHNTEQVFEYAAIRTWTSVPFGFWNLNNPYIYKIAKVCPSISSSFSQIMHCSKRMVSASNFPLGEAIQGK